MTKLQQTYPFKLLLIASIAMEMVLAVVLWSVYHYLTKSASNFRFETSEVFWLFLCSPLLLILFLLTVNWKNKHITQFGNVATTKKLFDSGSGTLIFLKYSLQKLGFIFLIIALANPQYGKGKKEMQSNGIDIMVALDVSNSMLARDVAGGMERLKLAKLALEKLIYTLKGDRIGIVVFAGNAYKQLPITIDYDMSLMYLSAVSTDMLSNQGTAIGRAIDSCLTSFNYDMPSNKTIIIISDGEDHEADAITAAQRALEKNVVVNTIGIGSLEGSTIPNRINGKEEGVKRDEEGSAVISRMNPELMQAIANAGGGTYTYGQGTDLGLPEIIERISRMEKKKVSTDSFTEFEDHFQLFLLIGMLLLLLDTLVINKKTGWLGTLLYR